MKNYNKLILALVMLGGQVLLGFDVRTIRPIRAIEKDPQAWFKKASSDLLSAKKLGESLETFDAAVYHTQQAAEKALKAYLIFVTKVNPHSHDLVELLNLSKKYNPGFEPFSQYAFDLTPYATCHRYPGFACYYATGQECCLTRQEVLASIGKAAAILDFVKKQISTVEPTPVQKLQDVTSANMDLADDSGYDNSLCD